MRNIGTRVSEISQKLRRVPGVQLLQEEFRGPLDPADTQLANAQRQGGVPSELLSLYLSDTGGFALRWSADDEVLGAPCRRGHGVLLDPGKAHALFDEHRGVARGIAEEGVDADPGRKAVVDDWSHWFPAFLFPSGDCFCLETRTLQDGQHPVVFLEHDVMDAGPNLHGLVIAPSIRQLLERWSMLGFVDVYDWTDYVQEDGINVDDVRFAILRSILL